MPLVKIRVGDDGLARNFVEGDVLCREIGRAGDYQRVADARWILDRPRQRLHRTQAATHHCGKALDAELVGESRLCIDPVFDGDNGEVRAPGFAGGGVD